MKKKNQTKKLMLQKSVIQKLGQQDMAAIFGGADYNQSGNICPIKRPPPPPRTL